MALINQLFQIPAKFPKAIVHAKFPFSQVPHFQGVAAAYWAHSPVVVMTPEAGTLTKGHGGFQEVDQLPLFEVCASFVLTLCFILSFLCVSPWFEVCASSVRGLSFILSSLFEVCVSSWFN